MSDTFSPSAPPPTTLATVGAPEASSTLRAATWTVHLLYAAAIVTGVTGIVGLVVAYLKRGDAAGTIYASHLAYAIRTFWIGLALTLVGIVLSFAVIGVPLLVLTGIWFIVRCVKPMVLLADGKPIARPGAFF